MNDAATGGERTARRSPRRSAVCCSVATPTVTHVAHMF